MSEEVVIITEGMFDAMLIGKAVCVGGLWIALPPGSELKLIDLIEQKLVKDYGLDFETEEEK